MTIHNGKRVSGARETNIRVEVGSLATKPNDVSDYNSIFDGGISADSITDTF
jgi:hypothetical protein